MASIRRLLWCGLTPSDVVSHQSSQQPPPGGSVLTMTPFRLAETGSPGVTFAAARQQQGHRRARGVDGGGHQATRRPREEEGSRALGVDDAISDRAELLIVYQGVKVSGV